MGLDMELQCHRRPLRTHQGAGERRDDKVKKLIIICAVFFLLTGCDNSMQKARARNLRAATNRADDRHDLRMDDSYALTPVRLIVKEVLWWSLMVSGVLVLVSFAGAFSYFTIGASYYTIRDMKTQKVPLDTDTRQYPLLLYGNGRRVFNPNNGERLLLSDVSEADLPRIEAATQVQLVGLLSDGSKVVNGKVVHHTP